MRRNSCLETMAGCVSSTRTGGAPSLALAPQTTVPAYASLVSTKWTVVLSHFLPLEVGMPSALRVLVDVQGAFALEGHVEDAPGHGVGGRVQLQLGALRGPILDVDPLVAVGCVGGHPEASRGGLPHPSDNLLGEDISYPIKTKNQIHMGCGTLNRCDCFGGLWGLHGVRTLVGRARQTLTLDCWKLSRRCDPHGSPAFSFFFLAKILHALLYLCNILVYPCQDVRVRLSAA